MNEFLEIPKKAMVIFAHPDDAEIGTGGTVAKWIDNDADIVYVLATTGSSGSNDLEMTSKKIVDIRSEEQTEAARTLGVSNIVSLNYIDGELEKLSAISWKDKTSVCVVLAAKGYPESYQKNDEIFGTEEIFDDAYIFHAGTKKHEEKIRLETDLEYLKNDLNNAYEEIIRYEESYRNHGQQIPVFEYALSWLKDNIPKEIPLKLVHGDFRNGNLIISKKDYVSAVLDWEIFHIGDPYEDLSWICVNSWRFNKIDLPVGGFGHREDMYKSYEKESGEKIDRNRAKFWEILGTLKWGIMCLNMIEIYRSGYDKSIDRASIGRRSSETEIDLIRKIIL